MLANMGAAEILKLAAIALVVCALIGGVVSQTSGGASARGFFEGMWKGVEIFFIGVVAIAVLMGIFLVIGMVSNALNT